MSGIDEQIKEVSDLECPSCNNAVSIDLLNDRGEEIWWVDSQVRVLKGKRGYRTKTKNIVMDDIKFFKCCSCYAKYSVRFSVGQKLLEQLMFAPLFGVDVN